MNLILFTDDEIHDGAVTVSGRRAKHIRKVLRCEVGDSLRIGVINGSLGTGVVTEITTRSASLTISLDTAPPKPLPTELILAVPRPIMLKRVLAQATSCGVRKIYLVNANRVEKSFFQSTLIKEQAFAEPLTLGLEQAVDTWMPEISIHPRFRPFAEDLLPDILQDSPISLLAHPTAETPLAKLPQTLSDNRVVLAIGPEGGWVDFEVGKFIEQGFTPFSMGPRILRVDTAVPALLGQIGLLRTISAAD